MTKEELQGDVLRFGSAFIAATAREFRKKAADWKTFDREAGERLDRYAETMEALGAYVRARTSGPRNG